MKKLCWMLTCRGFIWQEVNGYAREFFSKGTESRGMIPWEMENYLSQKTHNSFVFSNLWKKYLLKCLWFKNNKCGWVFINSFTLIEATHYTFLRKRISGEALNLKMMNAMILSVTSSWEITIFAQKFPRLWKLIHQLRLSSSLSIFLLSLGSWWSISAPNDGRHFRFYLNTTIL